MTQSQLHERTLELLRGERRPKFLNDLEGLGESMGHAIPASLVEAYRVAGAFLNAPICPELEDWEVDRHLVFLSEGAGVWSWAIPLDRTPNPSVEVQLNELGADWIHACPDLSTFLYTVVFDLQHWLTH